MKKILIVLFRNAPSSMVRALVFESEFKKRGYTVEFFSIPTQKIEQLIQRCSKSKLMKVVNPFLRRLESWTRSYRRKKLLTLVGGFDRVIVVKYVEADFLKAIKQAAKGPVLYEFDDAMWLPQFFGPERFRRLVELADCVSTENVHLAIEAKKFNPKTFVYDGPPQVELFEPFRKLRQRRRSGTMADDRVVLGWIGSPGNLYYLYRIFEVLERIGARFPQVALRIVGAGRNKDLMPNFERMRVETVPFYDQQKMMEEVCGFDVGLFPLFQSDVSICRGTLKARIYMSGGIPVVASRFGDSIELIQDGENGFLATSDAEWEDKIAHLIVNRPFREAIGQKGLATVLEHYSVERCFDALEKNYLHSGCC